MEVPQEDVGKAVVLQENRTLQQDHALLEEKIEKVMDGEDVKAMFPVSHNEKMTHLEDVNDNEEDWKSELDHVEGILASRAQFVTRVDWKNPTLLRRMPIDINLLLGEDDINHLNNILQDDQNDFTFFHQLGLLSAYLQVAPLGSDDAHTYRQIPQIAHRFAFECSNGCENIFTKQGQNKKVNNSNVYVMASKLKASNYLRLKNISAFLKGNEFYDLQQVTQKN